MRNVDAAGLGIGDDHPPRIMGVLNVSAESPYDPSVYADPGEAATYVDEELIDEGAEIVDVGLESANKDLEVLSPDEELERLDTALEAMASTSGDAVWSIETRYHEVADAALSRGFDMVNDVCGFADPEMPRVCADYDAAVSKMASPRDLERPGAIEAVDDIYDALAHNGFTERTILDPAFGGWSESKTLADDRETFRRLREFRGYGRPLLVSINRKNFLRDVAGRSTEAALPVSLAATSMAVERGAHVIRTHDVAETRDAALIGAEFARERTRLTGGPDAIAVEELDVTTTGEVRRHLERLAANGDGDVASRSVVRTYELGGLTPEAVDVLRSATAPEETAATFVLAGDDAAIASTPAAADGGIGDHRDGGKTDDGDPDGPSHGLLLGTPAALSSVKTRVSDVSDALDAVFREITGIPK